MTLFEIAKEVSALDACVRYTGEVPVKKGRKSWCRCPFHAEKTASCSFDGKLFYCFGCHEGGSSIDFVAKLFELSPKDAAEKLRLDFGLAAPTYVRPLYVPQSRAAVEQAVSNMDTILVGYTRWCDNRLAEIDPNADDHEAEDLMALYLRERERAARLSEELLSAPFEQQTVLLRQHGTWAATLKENLLRWSQLSGERYWGTNA